MRYLAPLLLLLAGCYPPPAYILDTHEKNATHRDIQPLYANPIQAVSVATLPIQYSRVAGAMTATIPLDPSGKLTVIGLKGANTRYDFDGVPPTIRGPLNLIGDSGDPPQAMMRLSRDSMGNSCNNSLLEGIHFTGRATVSQLIDEGQEISEVRRCWFEQADASAPCLIICNDRALPDAIDAVEPRISATNSGKVYESCAFGGWILIRGSVGEIEFRNCWFHGKVRLEHTPDEQWAGGGRTNMPRKVAFTNPCTDLQSVNLECDPGVDPTGVVVTGWNVDRFHVVGVK